MDENEHQVEVMSEIGNELARLFSTYDTKTLATIMMFKSAQALRALHSSGVWRVEDVQAVVQGSLSDIYTPLENQPKVAMIGAGTLGAGTLQ